MTPTAPVERPYFFAGSEQGRRGYRRVYGRQGCSGGACCKDGRDHNEKEIAMANAIVNRPPPGGKPTETAGGGRG